MRTLLVFFAIGLALQGLQAVISNHQDGVAVALTVNDQQWLTQELTKQLGRPPNKQEITAAQEDFLHEQRMLWRALELGWHEKDEVIQRRLANNAKFTGVEESSGAAKRVPYSVMLEDPVIRQRLLQKWRRSYSQWAKREVEEAVLREFYQQHRNRYQHPQRYQVTHRFTAQGSERQPTSFVADDRWVTEAQLQQWFGNAWRVALEKQHLRHRWQSGAGAHDLQITALQQQADLPFEKVRNEVLEDWWATQQQTAIRQLDQLFLAPEKASLESMAVGQNDSAEYKELAL